MIVGANFNDKGSQARLYNVIDELRKRFSDCEIYYAHNDEQLDAALYRFGKISFTKKTQAQLLKSNPLGGITKLFRKKEENPSPETDVANIVSQLDLMIDVSDHVLVDTNDIADIEYYLDNIKIAKKYKIPMIIMPQSFGPLNFGMDDMHILGDMKDILFYPKVIFTREQDGYNELMGYFGLDNLRRSTDMLLVDNNFELSNVCSRFYRPEIPEITTSNNIAIVPNAVAFTKKFNDHSIDLYKKLFEALNNVRRNVYIICQATSDMEVCKELASRFKMFENIHFIDRELDCVEFDMLIKKFDIVISSHYSACIQAYRNYTPVLLLGSGARYKELAELLGQESLFFDILSEDCNNFDIQDELYELIADLDLAKTRIQTRMLNIQNESCFGVLDELNW